MVTSYKKVGVDITEIKKDFQVDVTGLDDKRELVITPRSY